MSSAALEMLTSRGHGSAGRAAAALAAGALAACAATWVETAKNVASATLDTMMTRRIFMVRPEVEMITKCAARSSALPTPRCRRRLPAERCTHRRSAHDQFLDRGAGTHIVGKVAPTQHKVTPPEFVTDGENGVRGRGGSMARRPGTDIGFIGHVPLAIIAQAHCSLHANNAGPDVHIRVGAGGGSEDAAGSEGIHPERTPESAIARPGNDVEIALVAARYGVTASQRPDQFLETDVDVDIDLRRNFAPRRVERLYFRTERRDVRINDVGEHAPVTLARAKSSHRSELQVADVVFRLDGHRRRRRRTIAQGEIEIGRHGWEPAIDDKIVVPLPIVHVHFRARCSCRHQSRDAHDKRDETALQTIQRLHRCLRNGLVHDSCNAAVMPAGYFGNMNWTWARICQLAPKSGFTTL